MSIEVDLRPSARTGVALLVVCAAILGVGGGGGEVESYIVRAADLRTAADSVEAVGGQVTHELAIIQAVGAKLRPAQAERLRSLDGVTRIWHDRRVEATARPPKPSDPPASPICAAVGESLVSFGDIYFDWQFDNTGNITLTIDRIRLEWVEGNGPLQKIKLGRSEIFREDRQPTETVIESFLGSVGDRQVKAGRTGKLKVVFPDKLSRRQSDYRLEIDFAEGCGVSYVPGARGGETFPDGYIPDTFVPRWLGAPVLWQQGITGYGVTIAVVDTYSKFNTPGLKHDTRGIQRALAFYDAATDTLCDLTLGSDCDLGQGDVHGHGTHVSGIAVNSALTDFGQFAGVAPDAGLLVVRALGDDGSGSYADVVRAIDWVVSVKALYGIGVMNLSMSAPAQSHYWDDPLNQAVMAAWQAGIVVVASAGNTGPDPMSVGVPGNVPYVITVGAASDHYSHTKSTDDFLTSFSASGPTYEGFVKPEVVAPGGHVISTMQDSTLMAMEHAEHRFGDKYFQMSGTSQSTAAVSGVVALMLDADPSLTPDDVKCRLMAAARPAVRDDGTLAYSVFQQGAGLVNAVDAVNSIASGCANRGLDVSLDLLGVEHFGGRANQAPDGTYYLTGLAGDGYAWNDGYMWSDGYFWSDGYVWNDGYAWSDGFAWSDGYMWSDGYAWSDAFLWSDALSLPMAVDNWVEQE